MGPEEQKNTTPVTPEQNGSLETAGSSSLEDTSQTTETNSLDTDSSASTAGKIVEPAPAPTDKPPLWRRITRHLNIYLLLFILLLVVAGSILAVAYMENRKAQDSGVSTQTLSQDTLNQLATSDVTVGDPKQVLNIQGNAVFAGKVLIRDTLEVAGQIQIGGDLSLPGLTVSGDSIFEQIQVNKDLNVQGNSSIQGQLNVQKGLTVAGSGAFKGDLTAASISANTLQLNGTLTITKHVAVGGATPGRSNGSALGSGGTSSVSGSDTAGSININTGGGAAAGCFVTVNFTQKYNATPRVLITPVGSGAANVGYYVTRSTSNFSVCAANTPPSNSSFIFDYWVVE